LWQTSTAKSGWSQNTVFQDQILLQKIKHKQICMSCFSESVDMFIWLSMIILSCSARLTILGQTDLLMLHAMCSAWGWNLNGKFRHGRQCFCNWQWIVCFVVEIVQNFYSFIHTQCTAVLFSNDKIVFPDEMADHTHLIVRRGVLMSSWRMQNFWKCLLFHLSCTSHQQLCMLVWPQKPAPLSLCQLLQGAAQTGAGQNVFENQMQSKERLKNWIKSNANFIGQS